MHKLPFITDASTKCPHMHCFIVAVCKCRLWTEYFDVIWPIQVYIVEI